MDLTDIQIEFPQAVVMLLPGLWVLFMLVGEFLFPH
jgi:hypothetical protein